MDFIKYLKTLLYVTIGTFFINLILTLLYYFNIIGANVNSYLKLIFMAIIMITGGLMIGLKADKKGWLEGIKIGGLVICLMFLVSYLGFDKSLNIKSIIYYVLLILSSMLGSMIGINKKSSQKNY